jgi:homoserine O-acetyltransferase
MLLAAMLASCHGASRQPPPATHGAPAALPVESHDAVFDHRFRSGERLEALRLHYSTAGTPRRDAAGKIVNAVLVLHWTSASSAALQTEEFASSLYAPGKALDLARHYLVFVDNVGHGASSKPSDGLHAKFPRYGYRDMVELQHRLVHEVLGVDKLHAIVGLSMGGMHAWMWAETYPDEVAGIMPVVSLPTRIAGRNLVWRRIVARMIRTDPEWKGGEYSSPPRGWLEAFPLFRMMLDGVPHLQAIAPDRAAADAFVTGAVEQAKNVDANDVLYSLESSEDYDPEAALANVRAKVTALNFADDEFNPVELKIIERLSPKVPHARFVVQPGNEASFGHLTQAHPSLWADQVATFMKELEGS